MFEAFITAIEAADLPEIKGALLCASFFFAGLIPALGVYFARRSMDISLDSPD